jgi:betaine-aldehyde dehydrogenase
LAQQKVELLWSGNSDADAFCPKHRVQAVQPSKEDSEGTMDRNQLWIDGELVAPASGARIEVESPSTEEIVGSVPDSTIDDVDRAVAAASRAFKEGPWPRMSWSERAAFIRRAGELLAPQADELTQLVSSENGIMVTYRQGHVQGQFDWYLGLESLEEERTSPRGERGLIVKEPAGVVAAVLPWNVPVRLALGKLLPALLCGCTVVWKPAPETPLHTYPITQAFYEAGLPAGVLNVVPAGREVSEHLVAHPDIDVVSFTGSTAAGKRVGALCAGQVKRVALELGGKSAAIVLDDFDASQVPVVLGGGMLLNSGQACSAWTRLLVPSSRESELTDAFSAVAESVQVGDPFDPATVVGPLIAARQRDRVEGYIALAREEGAKVAIGGGRPAGLPKGYYIEPTVLASCTNQMRSSREEIFGPVVSVIPYGSEHEAVAIANDTNYGLAGAVFTSDEDHGVEVARHIRAGTVGVNTLGISQAFPFGGYKESGVGRQFGRECLEEFLEVKTIARPASK